MLKEDNLQGMQCEPCIIGTPPLGIQEQEPLRRQLHEDWQVIEGHHLKRSFKTEDFRSALDLTNRIGELAEQENHHPDITLSWGKVVVTLYTHKIDGLSRNDFILAAKLDSEV